MTRTGHYHPYASAAAAGLYADHVGREVSVYQRDGEPVMQFHPTDPTGPDIEAPAVQITWDAPEEPPGLTLEAHPDPPGPR